MTSKKKLCPYDKAGLEAMAEFRHTKEFDYEQLKQAWDKKFGKGEFVKFEKKWNEAFKV